jgi:hypothetical protein
MKQCLLIAITLLLPQLAVAANLVQNGSFENPAQDPGTWDLYSAIQGWNVVSGAGIELRNNNAGTAQNGNNYVELDSHNNSTIQQDGIATIAGSLYDLTFFYSPRIGQPASTNGIDVFWNGGLLASLTGDGGTDNIWGSHKFSVKGTGNDSLSFAASGRSDSLGGNLDNVSLNSVPVPAAFWLMASALTLLRLGSRRKPV